MSQRNPRIITRPASLAPLPNIDYGWKVCLTILDRTYHAILNPKLESEKSQNIEKLDAACITAENYISTHNKELNTTAISRRKKLLKYERHLVDFLLKEKKSSHNQGRINFFTEAIRLNVSLISSADIKLSVEINTDLNRWSGQLKEYKLEKSKAQQASVAELKLAEAPTAASDPLASLPDKSLQDSTNASIAEKALTNPQSNPPTLSSKQPIGSDDSDSLLKLGDQREKIATQLDHSEALTVFIDPLSPAKDVTKKDEIRSVAGVSGNSSAKKETEKTPLISKPAPEREPCCCIRYFCCCCISKKKPAPEIAKTIETEGPIRAQMN